MSGIGRKGKLWNAHQSNIDAAGYSCECCCAWSSEQENIPCWARRLGELAQESEGDMRGDGVG